MLQRALAISGLLLVATSVASPAAGQTSIVVNVAAESGQRLPYSVVTVLGGNGSSAFTDESGTYSFRSSASPVRLRIRHLGFAPKDTTINLAGTRSATITVRLTPVALQLGVVDVRDNNTCKRSSNNETLAAIMQELITNAEHERMLRQQYPFWYRLRRTYDSYEPGFGLRRKRDDVWYASLSNDRYRPGVAIRRAPRGRTRAYREVWIPSLLDLADTVFLRHHCFRYKGITTVDGRAVHQLDFEPGKSLTHSVDYRGSAYLDSATYVIRRADFVLTNIDLLLTSATSLEIYTNYSQLFPGVALFDRIRAIQRGSGLEYNNFESALIDDQKRIEVKFMRLPPGSSLNR
jgi:hypothetical protein